METFEQKYKNLGQSIFQRMKFTKLWFYLFEIKYQRGNQRFKILFIGRGLCYPTQRAEEILNKISNNINKTYTGLISVLQGFQKCIAWNPSN